MKSAAALHVRVVLAYDSWMEGTAGFAIRRAGLGDLDDLTRLHCASFRREEHAPMILGPRYVRATYRWLLGAAEAYALVAESEGKVVGLVAVCDRGFTWPMFRACFGELVVSLVTDPRRLLNGALWRRLLRNPSGRKGKHRSMLDEPGVAQMTIGAVDAAFRGLGVFRGLIEATRVVSADRGSRAIIAGVYKSNSASRRAFERAGWKESRAMETAETVFYLADVQAGAARGDGVPV